MFEGISSERGVGEKLSGLRGETDADARKVFARGRFSAESPGRGIPRFVARAGSPLTHSGNHNLTGQDKHVIEK